MANTSSPKRLAWTLHGLAYSEFLQRFYYKVMLDGSFLLVLYQKQGLVRQAFDPSKNGARHTCIKELNLHELVS